MKKFVSLLLVLVLCAVLVAGCNGNKNSDNTDNGNNNNANSGNDTPPAAEETGAVKLGLGIVNSIAKSKDYAPAEGDNAEVLPVGQVDTVIAAVTFDKDGKIVAVTIDTAQTAVKFDAGLKVTNRDDVLKTKVEKGEEYGMKRVSSIGKEWDEQIAELEQWMVGKTVAEVKAMELNEGKVAVADLTSKVTITVTDYLAAVEKAWNNAVDIEPADKLGLGHTISIAKSKDYAPAEGDKSEVLPTAQVDTVVAATAFTADGKVAGVIIDTAQIVVNFDKDGKVTSDKTAVLKTKVEKGDEYGMKRVSTIEKEWFEQIAELEKWMTGKTVNEITAMALDGGKPADADLTAKVTVTVTDYLAAVEEAAANAK
ncbi:MAG TPA: hypothetical protein GX699_08895 [Firmicutes bacterium]|nr:hypothetical protein [Bacillota bacterium]